MVKLLTSARGYALFSDDERYRFALGRKVQSAMICAGSCIGFIGMNPSTANHEVDDQTIKKEIGFAQKLGFARMMKCNLGGFISSDPKKLLEVQNPVGEENGKSLASLRDSCDLIIAAWGGMDNRIWKQFRFSVEMVKSFPNVKCLGKTKGGAPHHTSRIAYSTPLEDWRHP